MCGGHWESNTRLAYEPGAIPISQYFVPEIILKLGFISKRINAFHSKTRLARRVLWDTYFRKKTRLLKSIFFGTWGYGVDNFRLCDILVGKLRETRGWNTTKSSILKYYIIFLIKMSKISERVNVIDYIGHKNKSK